MKNHISLKNQSGQDLELEREFYARFNFQECLEGPYWMDIFSRFVQIADSKDEVLDLCCGDGSWDMVIALKGYQTLGVDLSKDMLEKRESLFKKYQQKSKSLLGDCTRLPLKAESFKTITIISGLHHFPNKEPIIREVSRVGTRDAVFFAWEPNLFNPLIWFDYWYKLKIKKDQTYSQNEYPINPLRLRSWLKMYFQDVRVYTVRALPNRGIWDRMDRLISKIPVLNLFGAIIVVVASSPKKK